MGIISKFKIDKKKDSTLGFYFGHTEAEGENKQGIQNHTNFFEDYLQVLNQIKDERFIFIGRKGSGKSAIAKFIQDTSDSSDDSFATIIRINELELERVIQSIPKEEFQDSEIILFEWLILVKLISLLVKNKDAVYTTEYKKLNDFLKRNAGFVDIDKFQVVEIIEKRKLEVSFDVLRHAFSAFGRYFDSKTVKAPFYKLIPPLKEIIQQVLAFEVFKNKEFWILFDDLDINFKEEDEASSQKIVNLLRVVKNLNTSILKNSGARVLIFLRDDVKRIIETFDTDTSKIFTSYEVPLNWYDHEIFKLNENQTNLKRFINKRISLNFKNHAIPFDEDDPWSTLFEEYQNSYGGKSSFKYILDFTFYRPRDLVLFLNPLGKKDYRFPVKPDYAKQLIKSFVSENINEIKSELKIHFRSDQIINLFNRLKTITNRYGALTKEETLKQLTGITPQKSSEEILKILLDYSILVYKDNYGRIYFNYRYDNNTIGFENMKLTTHKCIYTYFNPES